MDPASPLQPRSVGALVLAAGLSRRMGRPKLVLPWGEQTVIGQVVSQLATGGVTEICAVTGGAREQVEEALHRYAVRLAFNPQHADGEMLHSLQVGLKELSSGCEAALVALGDQPQIQARVVCEVIRVYREQPNAIIIPSYHMRRGHPWLIGRELWQDIFALEAPATLRDFLRQHADQIEYINLDEPSILTDLDTPEEYQSQRPD
jgi:molybdenum cofactor cytidylyltransferase